jgi:hypothetical protein
VPRLSKSAKASRYSAGSADWAARRRRCNGSWTGGEEGSGVAGRTCVVARLSRVSQNAAEKQQKSRESSTRPHAHHDATS